MAPKQSREGFVYTVNEHNEAEIRLYRGEAIELTIPAVIDGYPVKIVVKGPGANVACVELQEGIREIGDNAFVACKLTSVVLPASVVEFGDGAFSSCTELRRSELS